MQRFFLTIAMIATMYGLRAENGYRLWLRYDKIDNAKLLAEYQQQITGIQINNTSATLQVAEQELMKGLQGLLAKKIINQNTINNGSIIAGTPASSSQIKNSISIKEIDDLGNEGFIIKTSIINKKNVILIR